ncbi:MAG: SLC13 family permease, partial [Gemmatimonadetes bacterium]|nr:SLC13 family permease [Gemmatimonadota bacterium]
MEFHGWVTVIIGAAAAIAFVRRLAPPETVALGIPVLLAVTGVFDDPLTALQGFGNPAVIALGAIFVVGAGLQGSGLAAYVAEAIVRGGGKSEGRVVTLLMSATALVSGFMSNAATTALFLPATVRIARRAFISPSRLLLPMASAAVLGGTLTLIGTPPNLLISGYLESRVGEPFSIFRFALIGVPVLLTGILYTVTVGRRLLPDRSDEERLHGANVPEDLAESYRLARNLCRMKVTTASTVVGQTIAQANVRQKYGLSVVLVQRKRVGVARYLEPQPDLMLGDGDLLYVEGETEAAWTFAEEEGLQFGLAGPQAMERILGRGQTLAEVSIAPRSPALGHSLRDLRFRDRFGLNAISLWRQGNPVENLADLPLELGDALLVSGSIPNIQRLATDPDYLVLTDLSESADTRRAPLALLLLMLAVLPPI